MKRSGDLVIGRSGDRVVSLEPPNQNLTTEARRHGDGAGKWGIIDIVRHGVIGFRRTLRVTLAALREIFDESPYDRFLLRTQTARSVESYRAFLREREVGAARRPRCC